MRRQQLTEAQITALLDPPPDQRELVRHYTLFAADLAAIRRCRGDHNRLGHALMLCYLRYPGRPLRAGERPPRSLLLFIAEQIDALPEAIEDYLAEERNRRRHAAELQDRLGFRPFGTRPAADLARGLDPGRGQRVQQACRAQLAREAGRTTAQHIAGYERQRRHATLVAVTLDLAASLTDQAINLFDRLIGTMFRKADERHARAFQADGRAINEKVRLSARVGAALIAARDNKQDTFDAITVVIPWDRFLASVEEAEALARSEEFDAYQMLGEHYAGIRRWAPAFLDAFVFQSVPAAAALMRAIDTLRDMNRRAVPSLPAGLQCA